MYRRFILTVLLLACSVLAAILLWEASQLPSARALDPYLPSTSVTLPAEPCRQSTTLAVPAEALLPLEPALRAAETPARYASSIARSMLCTRHVGMLRYRLDELLMIAKVRLRFTPRQQITIFLNRAYFAGDVPGAASASLRLFQHPPNQLTLPQRALLMGMIRGPSRFDPTRNPPAALARRNAVLDRMLANGDITAEQAETARKTPLDHQLDHAG